MALQPFGGRADSRGAGGQWPYCERGMRERNPFTSREMHWSSPLCHLVSSDSPLSISHLVSLSPLSLSLSLTPLSLSLPHLPCLSHTQPSLSSCLSLPIPLSLLLRAHSDLASTTPTSGAHAATTRPSPSETSHSGRGATYSADCRPPIAALRAVERAAEEAVERAVGWLGRLAARRAEAREPSISS